VPVPPSQSSATSSISEEQPVYEWRPSLLLVLPSMVTSMGLWGLLFIISHYLRGWEYWLAGALQPFLGATTPSPTVWFYGVLGLAFLGLFMPPLVQAIRLMTTRYVVTTQRLHYYRGIMTRLHDQIEIIRIRDLSVIKPLALRVFGYGHVILHTVDRSHSMMELVAVPKPSEIKDILHQLSLAERQRLNYREFEATSPHQ